MDQIDYYGNDSILRVIWGNKIDQIGLRSVSFEEGLRAAEKYNASFIETSAKNGTNIEMLFEILSTIIFYSKEKQSF